MIKKILPFLFFAIPIVSNAQEVSEHYFKDESLRNEIPQEKANFVKIETKNPDGSLTTSVKNIKKDIIIRSHTYNGSEPVGVWIIQYGSGPKPIDYSFQLRYSEEKCSGDNGINVNDFFANNASIGYKAPKISTGEKTINQFLGKNIVYPDGAVREHIQGTVHVNFTITKDGNMQDIYVQQGANILLDKEAVRVIRKIKLAAPPTLNGQSRDLCVSVPVNFTIR